MTGKGYLDFIVGISGQYGMADKNPNDTSFRAFVLQCLNLVGKDIQTRQDQWHWRWLEKTVTTTTVAEQMDYDLPDDIDTNKIFKVFDRNNDITYTYVEHDKFLRFVPDPSNNIGSTMFWTFWANKMKLYPIPSDARTVFLKYIQTLSELTDSDSSTWEVPSKYDPIIIDGVMVYVYKFDPEIGDWKTQQQAYELGVQKMQRENSMMIDDLGSTESHRTRGYPMYGNRETASPLIL